MSTTVTTYVEKAWSKIQPFTARFLSFSPAIRFVLGALVSAIAGSGFLGFISEYAAYSYSLYYGLRPPLEGIPYLRVTVAASSFLLFLLAAAIFAATVLIGKYFLSRIEINVKKFGRISKQLGKRLSVEGPNPDDVMESIRNTSTLGILWKAAIMASFAYCFISIVPAYLGRQLSSISTPAFPLTANFLNALGNYLLNTPIFSEESGTTFSSMVFLSTLLIWKPKAVPTAAVCLTTAFFLGAPFILFHAPTYAKGLRSLGYGGGIPAQITAAKNPNDEFAKYSGYILLRTTEAMIFFDPEQGTIYEIPSQKIYSIETPSDRRSRLAYRLPENTRSPLKGSTQR